MALALRGAGAVALTLALTAQAGAQTAQAPAQPQSSAKQQAELSRYERETLDLAVAARKAEVDPAPEGKVIESIEVMPLDVLEPRDPPGRLWAPLTDFLNFFHATTRPYVVEREILVRVGERYDHDLVDETARNLRSIRQLSLVLAIPLKGSAGNRVRLLFVTKDIWSLRLNTNFRFAGGRLQYFLLQPSEENLLGTHQSLSGMFLLEGETYSLGGGYKMPRISGSRRSFIVDGNAIINRTSGDLEGSFGSIAYGQPLYSTQAEWAWTTGLAWRKEISRRYVDGVQAAFVSETARERSGVPQGTPLPPEYLIPYRYRSDQFLASYGVTRSFGRVIKHDLDWGFQISRGVYETEDLSAYDPQSVRDFQQEVPVTDERVGPFLQYSTYSTRFVHTHDLSTLGLVEDVNVGHQLVVRAYPITQALASTRDFIGLLAAARYNIPVGDGLVSAYAQSVTEAEAERLADASIEGGLHFASPSFKVARLLVDARVLNRYRNYLRNQTTLGGEFRLRGYPTGAFFGEDAVVGNAEIRSKPLELWSVHFGAAVFYDVGDAFDGWDDLRLKQSTGFGLRVLIPQLDRAVLRADWGFPLTSPTADDFFVEDSFPGDIILTFRQAFGYASVPSTFGAR